MEQHNKGTPGLIQLKSNALTDQDVIAALYQASQSGVKIDLIIRDSCLLRPGIPGLSENIRVVSLVGRFLEHSRIFYFKNNGQEQYYIGSADIMKRNLERRVEVITPIESPVLQAQLREIINLQLADRRGAWDMQPDGTYIQRTPESSGQKRSAQEQLIERSEKRLAEARRLYKKQYSKKIAKRKKQIKIKDGA